MFNINISIRNPFTKDKFEGIFCKEFRLTKNKNICIEFYKYSYYLLEITISTDYEGHDHAGPKLEIGLFGLNFDFKIYDSRHWDIETDDWINNGGEDGL